MKKLILINLILCIIAFSAEKKKELISLKDLSTYNPILSLLEPKTWKILQELEVKATKGDAESIKLYNELIAEITTKHPLLRTKKSITLGKVKLIKKDKSIEIPVLYNDPSENAVETILCNKHGRIHEALFTTKAACIHLELLLQIAGIKSGTLLTISLREASGKKHKLKSFFNEDVNLKFIYKERKVGGLSAEHIALTGGVQSVLWPSVKLSETLTISRKLKIKKCTLVIEQVTK